MRNPLIRILLAIGCWSLFLGTTYEVKENQHKVGEIIIHDGNKTSKPLEVIKRAVTPIDYPVRNYRQVIVKNMELPALPRNHIKNLNVYPGMPRALAEKNLLDTTANLRPKKYTEAVPISRLSSAEGPAMVNTVVYDYRSYTPTERHHDKVYFYNNEVLKTQHQVEPR